MLDPEGLTCYNTKTMKEKIALGEYYHIFNRGNNKQDIFFDSRDWIRFLFLILYFQSSLPIYNIGRQVTYFNRHQVFNISTEKIIKDRITELVSFALMPNHFHLILYESKQDGIPKYMNKIQDGYTKYINTKYNKSGHLFQGRFQRVHIKNNNQLLYLSTYIHRNPRELKHWTGKEEKFPWSSYQDFSQKNRWGELLKHQIITEQFSNPNEYKLFTEQSIAKLLDKDKKLLLDH